MDRDDDQPVVEATWQVARLNENTLRAIAALREQELFDQALRDALDAEEGE